MVELRKVARLRRIAVAALMLADLPIVTIAAPTKQCSPDLVGEDPIVPHSIEQADINSRAVSFDAIARHGRLLFTAKFNVCDGRGRPETTGAGDKRSVPTVSQEGEPLSVNQIAKLRTSAPDADSCAGCHNDPEIGGAGDFVANVFVLAQALDPVTLSISGSRSNSRNTLGMHGSGPIEMLAREMTAELQAQAAGLGDGKYTLSTKGVDFRVQVLGGQIFESQGIDHDLVVKPFHQAGKVTSLREFSTNAMNHHHGMQAEERFDLNPAKGFDPDYDGDGVQRELTIGDITAISIWQAQLSTPTQVIPRRKDDRDAVALGERMFEDNGCAACHRPAMVLDSPLFVEPNPYNPPGTCSSAAEGCPDFAFDMTREGDGHRLERKPNGGAIVRAYTDLKRHNLCDDPGPDAIRWFCNEELAQGRPEQNGKPGQEFFLTRKLWDVGSSAPYGHRGDISTISEAILYHGGEGRASRDAFAASPAEEKRALVAFLKTLHVRPPQAQD